NRCDWVAQGVVQAARETQLAIPLVVRLAGTNVEEGRKILKDSGLPIITADSLSEAAERVVHAFNASRSQSPARGRAASGLAGGNGQSTGTSSMKPPARLCRASPVTRQPFTPKRCWRTVRKAWAE